MLQILKSGCILFTKNFFLRILKFKVKEACWRWVYTIMVLFFFFYHTSKYTLCFEQTCSYNCYKIRLCLTLWSIKNIRMTLYRYSKPLFVGMNRCKLFFSSFISLLTMKICWLPPTAKGTKPFMPFFFFSSLNLAKKS